MPLPLLGFIPIPQLGLLLLWACLLYGGMLAPEQPGRNRRMPRWMRLGSSLVLVAAAVLWWHTGRGAEHERFAVGLMFGMALGTVGDFFLADMFPVRQPLVGGLAAFGVGHIAYVSAFVFLLARMNTGLTLQLVFPAVVLGSIVGWWLLVFPTKRSGALRWGALGYAVLLASTAGLALGIGLSKPELPGLLLLGAGGMLFWLSDVILALRVFRGAHFRLLDDWVWLTYGTGQMLIVYSSATVLPLRHYVAP